MVGAWLESFGENEWKRNDRCQEVLGSRSEKRNDR